MLLNLQEEYKRYCQWEYSMVKKLSTIDKNIIENKIEKIVGAKQILIKMIKTINGGKSIKTHRERQEIENIYKIFEKKFKKLLTND